jgi:hypothetical protein
VKLKARLRGNKLTFPVLTVINKPEVEVEVEILDEFIQVYPEEEIDKMSVTELAHVIWDNVEIDEKEINRDYKELLTEALLE